MSFAAVLSRLARLENPYPGLRPFDTAEAHLFFGRDQQVLDLSDRLARNHFAAVLGLSGSGKSSLVRAGLIPSLERGRLLEPGKTWRVAVVRPSGAPFECLAKALNCPVEDIRASSHGLIDWARQTLNPQQEALLVVIDQFEELFRYKDSNTVNPSASSEAAAFIALLLASARSPLSIYVIVTMRTDYLGDCAEFPDFPEVLNESQYLVPRLTREQRRQAIEGPLGRVRISSALVERILNDAGDEPDQLPILQHVLMRTWSQWRKVDPNDTRPIDNTDYETVGGFAGALNKHADELLKTDAVLAAPNYVEIIFKRLTALGRNNRERRDPSVLSELWELCAAQSVDARQRVNAIVDVFRQGDATFLAPREGELLADTYVDIAHESLIRNWKILSQRWLPDEERQAKTLIELVERAQGWQAHERELLTGLDVTSARQWNRSRNPAAVWAEHYVGHGKLELVQSFIAASNRRRARPYLIAVPIFLGGLALFVRSDREQTVAESLNLAGQAESLISLGRSSEAVETAQKALRVSRTSQARTALAHAFPQELIEYKGHAAVFSPDEKYVLTARADKEAQLWDTVTGAPLVTLSGHTAEIHSVRFSPNGQRILTAAGQTARLWETGNGKLLATLDAHTSDITSALFSPNGQLVVTAGSDWTARIWDAASGGPIATFTGHSGVINTAVFSPDSQRVVTASHDGTACVWNAANGHLIAKLQGHTAEVRSAVFSPDGQFIVTAGADAKARLWNASNGQPLATLTGHKSALNSAGFSPDGKLVVTSSDDQTAAVWNASSGQLVVAFTGHAAPVTSAVFSPDGQRVLTASRDSTARVWNVSSGSLLAELLGHNGFLYSAAFSANGLRVLTAGEDNTARLWNLTAAADVSTTLTGHTDGINSADFSPDDKLIVTAALDHSVQVWNRESGKSLLKIDGHSASVNSARFSPDGTRILTASADDSAALWNSANGKLIAKFPHPEDVNSAVFSPDGARILTASNDKLARIWNASSSKVLTTFIGHKGLVLNASFSPNGKTIATASEDKSACIWDAATGKILQTLAGHTGIVWTAAFSRNGQHVVTTSDDGTARVWDAATGRQIMSLNGHNGAVYSAAFSYDDKLIVTAGFDKTARIWDAVTGQVIAKMEGHSDSASTAAFSHNSQYIVTSSFDHTALVFTLLKRNELEALLNRR